VATHSWHRREVIPPTRATPRFLHVHVDIRCTRPPTPGTAVPSRLAQLLDDEPPSSVEPEDAPWRSILDDLFDDRPAAPKRPEPIGFATTVFT